jgi:hypothetical protein
MLWDNHKNPILILGYGPNISCVDASWTRATPKGVDGKMTHESGIILALITTLMTNCS